MQRGDSMREFGGTYRRMTTPVVDAPRPARVSIPASAHFATIPDTTDLPAEHVVTIEINGRPVARLICTPFDLEALGAGWVFGQGFALAASEIRSVSVNGARISVMIDAPGPGGRAWGLLIASGLDARHLLVEDLGEDRLEPLSGWRDPEAFRVPPAVLAYGIERVIGAVRAQRGGSGVQHAALINGANPLVIMRDVSRHNAVDKVIGWAIRSRIAVDECALVISGRISADIVFKAWRSGIPLVVSRSLPTAEAVDLATEANITLIGRAFDDRRAIYSAPWRVDEHDDRAGV